MIIINGQKFYEEPTSCGTCPFLLIYNSDAPVPVHHIESKYHCLLFDEMHASWRSVPRRCQKLFKKAFTYPEGTELVLVSNNE